MATVGCGSPNPVLEEVQRAVGETRPVVARSTAFPTWSRCAPSGPGGFLAPMACGPEAATTSALARLEGRLLAAIDRGDLRSLHLAGLLRLARLTRAEEAEDAVDLLEQAQAAHPDEATLLADLAAAYVARGQWTASPFDLVRALDATVRALDIDPDHAPAAFNRAWLLDHLALHDQAADAWRRFLEIEAAGGWADEARAHLRRLPRPDMAGVWQQEKESLIAAALTGDDLDTARTLVGAHRQRARRWVEDEVLAQWAEAVATGDREGAEEHLDVVRMVDAVFEELDGDRLAGDALAIIERVDATSRRALVAGHRAYADGVREIGAGRYDLAAEPLALAERLLTEGGSPFADRAAFQRLRCTYQRSDYDAVLRDGAALLERIDAERYPALAARVAWVRGTAAMGLGCTSEAAEGYRTAGEHFARIGEVGNIAAAGGLLASALAEEGDHDGAWAARYEALQALDPEPRPRRLRLLLTAMAFDAADAGLHRAALAFQDEAVALAESSPTGANGATSAYLHRAVFRWLLDDAEGTETDLTAADSHAAGIADVGQRTAILADVAALRGRIVADRDPVGAIAFLDEADALFRETQFDLQLPMLLQTRAHAHARTGDVEAAARDLYEAIDRIEARRGLVWSVLDRIAFFDGQTAYDMLTELELADGGEAEALLVSERGKARALLDQVSAAQRERSQCGGVGRGSTDAARVDPDVVERVRQSLTPADAVLAFEVLEGRTLAWALRHDGLVVEEISVSRSELVSKLDAILVSLSTSAESSTWTVEQPMARDFAESLIGPIWDVTRGADRWIVIPDEALVGVPWNALSQPDGTDFLSRNRSVSVAPSLSLLSQWLAEAQGGPEEAVQHLVAVGDPAFDRDRYPALKQLDKAQQEATVVASGSSSATLLLGAQATPEALLAALGTADAAWIGAHALADPSGPERSALVLAPGASGKGVLSAADLFDAEMPNLRTVVLTACRAAPGGRGGGASREALLGLVWPFLANGVRDVVASPVRLLDEPVTIHLRATWAERVDALLAPGSLFVRFGLGPGEEMRPVPN